MTTSLPANLATQRRHLLDNEPALASEGDSGADVMTAIGITSLIGWNSR